MDPSAMDFMMHHQQSHANPATSPLENSAYTHCPALRSAADPQSLLNSPTRGTHHYDPVHGSTTYRHRWRAQQPQRAWHLQRPDQPSQDPFHMPSAPGMPQPNHAAQPPFSLLAEAESYHLHSPSFHYRPPMPALPRIGSTAPAQHTHGNLPAPSQPQAGTPNLPLHRGHVQRTSSSLPAVSPGPHQTLAQPTRMPAMSTENNTPPTQPAEFSPLDYLRQENNPPASFSRPEPNMQARSAGDGGNPQPGPAASHGSGDALNPAENRRNTTGRMRRHLPRLPSSAASDWSSDDDPDTADPDSNTFSVIEAVSAGQLTEDRLREQQILRGAVSGRRVASKKAIASLQSVNISDLPENERTCVICYNDFGVANPEGINEAPLRLPKCKHVFGDHCIKKWFVESDSCPYCRDKVPSEPQYHRSMTTHNVLRFMRQHHLQIQQLQQTQAARQALSRERERSEATSPPGRPTSTMLNSMPALTSSPFSEFGFGGSGDASTARRVENTYMYGSRPSGWHAAPERRSPPNEFNDGRRRTRARHGSLRGSPPSGRTNSFNMSPTSNQGNHQSQNPYPWFTRHVTNSHRNSATTPFDANAPPPFSLHSPAGASEPYLNPLNASSTSGVPDDYPLTLPQMRSQYIPPLSPTVGGPDVYMANSDDAVPNHSTSHQQF